MKSVEWVVVPMHSADYYRGKVVALKRREADRKEPTSVIDVTVYQQGLSELGELIKRAS